MAELVPKMCLVRCKWRLKHAQSQSCVCAPACRELDSYSLTGRLSRSLGRLSSLRMIDLSHNQLTGTLPREWKYLTNLKASMSLSLFRRSHRP